MLHELQPDLIVTQALCAVCAVSYDDVRAIAEEIDTQPQVIALDPHTLGRGARRRAHARPGHRPQGRRRRARSAMPRTGSIGSGSRSAVRSAAAGGRARVARPAVRGRSLDAAADRVRGRRGRARASPASLPRSAPGRRSRPREPDVVIVMPCGYDAEIAHREAEMHRDELVARGRGRGRRGRCRRVLLAARARGSSTGLELLAHILHPELVSEAPEGATALDGSRSERGAPPRDAVDGVGPGPTGTAEPDAVRRQPVPARDGDRARDADRRRPARSRERERLVASALGHLDDQRSP